MFVFQGTVGRLLERRRPAAGTAAAAGYWNDAKIPSPPTMTRPPADAEGIALLKRVGVTE